jgi:hypothetical protein
VSVIAKPIYLFLDESGEEGFGPTSSEWFILSGAIQDASDARLCRETYNRFREMCDRQDNWHFHFQNADHRLRLAFARSMRPAGYVFVSVAVHKASLTRTDNFKRPYFLYFYAAKLLLERVSWICRRQHRKLEAVYFSTRRGLKQAAAESYFRLLQANASGLQNNIYWPAVRDMEIHVEPNKKRIGLQMADLKASSVGQALTLLYDENEPRYLLEIKDQCFAYGGSRLGYGLKFFPALSPELRAEPRFKWLDEFERLPEPTPLP